MKLLLLSAAAALLTPTALAQGGNDCANATAISGYGLYSWDNTNATTTGPADCNGRPARKDLWWAWTAPATEGVRFETCGTSTTLSTRIVAYDGADCGAAGNLAVGGTGSDNENVNWLNAGTTDVTAWMRIELWAGDVLNDCNSDSMTVTGAMSSCGGGGGIGSNDCSTNPNSSGLSARMTAAGSAIAADDDLTLSGVQLPVSVPALFITSSTQGFVTNPSGSIGNLCLGGAIGRYIGPGQIQFADAMGVVSLPIDLTMVPQSSGFISVMAGDSRSFQIWFRDLVGGAPV